MEAKAGAAIKPDAASRLDLSQSLLENDLFMIVDRFGCYWKKIKIVPPWKSGKDFGQIILG
ncbi:hypothetical protein GCM10027164_38900 [Algoriphagus taiwanensis]